MRVSNIYYVIKVAIPGGYTQWSEWSICGLTCGKGVKVRTRACSNPPPSNGGLNCVNQGLGDAAEISTCNEGPCSSKFRWLILSLNIKYKITNAL